MEMPKYPNLARIVTWIGAAVACLVGVTTILGGLAAFRFGILMGISAISWGVYRVVASTTRSNTSAFAGTH